MAAPKSPSPRDECDLILKGGLASGVVYAEAVPMVARTHVLRSIGGASAGAVGAVFAAACEYARARAGTMAAFDALEHQGCELERDPRRLTAVFRPTTAWRRLLFWALLHPAGRVASALAMMSAFVTVLVLARTSLIAAVAAPLLLALTVVFLLTRRRKRGKRADGDLRVEWLALGTGMRRHTANPRRRAWRRDKERLPLTEWLHHYVQAAAGRRCEDPPLTFAEVARARPDAPIDLRIVVTDLALRRRVVLPVESEARGYHYDATELERLFPPAIVSHLAARPPRGAVPRSFEGGLTLHPLPTDDLPIVFAARASAAFPGLFCPIPVWTVSKDGRPHRHLLVDGGVAENFPVSFFDSWIPTRPTFGIRPMRQKDQGRIAPLPAFASDLFSTLVNGRDTLQAEMAGFAKRNIDVDLRRGLGEANFWPTPDDICAMLRQTNASVVEFFAGSPDRDAWSFDEHRRLRLMNVMGEVEDNVLGGASSRPGVVTAWRDRLRDDVTRAVGDCPAFPEVGAARAEGIAELIATVERWKQRADPLFPPAGPEHPRPVLRLAHE
jgi:predicted acylesterase/phospholipase RssA